MKKGKLRTRDQLHRCHTHGFNGIPPKNISGECFLRKDDPRTNGEIWFYRMIKPNIKSLFDVGADTTFYTNFDNEVHYFEPISDSNIFEAQKQVESGNNILKNKISYFNNFGLSNTSGEKLITWEAGDVLPNPLGEDTYLGDNTHIKTKRADDYIIENNFNTPDFVSTDTEGHELQVIQGFGELLSEVKIIQFEYNSTWYSADVKLNDMITYLKDFGFTEFNYLSMNSPKYGLVPMKWEDNSEDHYAHCNIVCCNNNWVNNFKSIFKI